MTVRMLRWLTGCVAAVSVGLLVGGIALSYVDRHMGPLSRWDYPNVFEETAFIAVPAVGFVLASRRPGNRVGSWSRSCFRRGLHCRPEPFQYAAAVPPRRIRGPHPVAGS